MSKKHSHSHTKILHDKVDYQDGTVNPPVQHASTLRAPDYLSYIGKKKWEGKHYGRHGLKTHRALEDAVAVLENAHGVVLTASGLQAVALSLISFLTPGDTMLMSDNVYPPVKTYAENFLARMNIKTIYFDPLADTTMLEKLTDDTVKLLYLESPGSGTFECHDIISLVAFAKKHHIISVLDNSWGAGVYLKPLNIGVDVSVISATKYISGHSDILLGTVSAKSPQHYAQIADTARFNGFYVAPDEAYLALRGIRTMPLRLKQHQQTAEQLMEWLKTQNEVTQIASPVADDWFGHEFFKRDFTGACGLFGFYLDETDDMKLAHFFDNATLYSMGASWGGYESLMVPMKINRSASPHLEKFSNHTLVRVHVGLEEVSDLIASMADGFQAMRGSAKK